MVEIVISRRPRGHLTSAKKIKLQYSGVGYYGIPTFDPRYDSKNLSIQIFKILNKYTDKISLSDHFQPIAAIKL